MHVSELTVKRPVLASVISLFLVLIGIISYDKLTIREYPDIDKPVITVSTIYRGASAEIMERDVWAGLTRATVFSFDVARWRVARSRCRSVPRPSLGTEARLYGALHVCIRNPVAGRIIAIG